ncbi:MAG: ABC transporter permease, partial [Candidatus Nanopelagicaceae bacterium]
MKASPMINYIIRRMMVLVISLFLASTTLFVLLRMLPGDPANALLTVGATPEQVAAARHSVGSDLPMLQQFWNWINDLVTFQLGTSLIGNVPV